MLKGYLVVFNHTAYDIEVVDHIGVSFSCFVTNIYI